MSPTNFWAYQASKLISMAIFAFSRQFYIPYKFPEVKERTWFGMKLQSFMVTTVQMCRLSARKGAS